MILKAGEVYSKEVAEHFMAQGYEFQAVLGGLQVSGWKGLSLDELRNGGPRVEFVPPQAMTVCQLIERLCEIRDAGHGGSHVEYTNRDGEIDCITEIRNRDGFISIE